MRDSQKGAGGLGLGAGEPLRTVAAARPEVSHFRDLIVWQRGMGLVEAVYRLSCSFPKSEIYGLTSQLRRAAVSVPSNIAEGHTRASTREYLNHLSIAQASLAEVETQLELASRLGYLDVQELPELLDLCDVLGKQIRTLRKALLGRI